MLFYVNLHITYIYNNNKFLHYLVFIFFLTDSLFSNDEEDDDDDLLDAGLGHHHHHHPSLSPGSTSLPGMVTPTKGLPPIGDTDVRTPITSSGDNSNPEKDNGNESEVSIPRNIFFIFVQNIVYIHLSICPPFQEIYKLTTRKPAGHLSKNNVRQ